MVEFQALITKINIKRSASMDKEGVLWLEFLPTHDLVDGLNKLMNVDKQVKVRIEKDE